MDAKEKKVYQRKKVGIVLVGFLLALISLHWVGLGLIEIQKRITCPDCTMWWGSYTGIILGLLFLWMGIFVAVLPRIELSSRKKTPLSVYIVLCVIVFSFSMIKFWDAFQSYAFITPQGVSIHLHETFPVGYRYEQGSYAIRWDEIKQIVRGWSRGKYSRCVFTDMLELNNGTKLSLNFRNRLNDWTLTEYLRGIHTIPFTNIYLLYTTKCF